MPCSNLYTSNTLTPNVKTKIMLNNNNNNVGSYKDHFYLQYTLR